MTTKEIEKEKDSQEWKHIIMPVSVIESLDSIKTCIIEAQKKAGLPVTDEVANHKVVTFLVNYYHKNNKKR